jgi:hypothetical protein
MVVLDVFTLLKNKINHEIVVIDEDTYRRCDVDSVKEHFKSGADTIKIMYDSSTGSLHSHRLNLSQINANDIQEEINKRKLDN